jgi:Mg2+/Co2+ transporter CorB
LREINRSLRWQLPTSGPKTLNGLVLEALESIPERGTALRIAGYTIEILQATEHAVKMARVTPPAASRPAPK